MSLLTIECIVVVKAKIKPKITYFTLKNYI